MLEWAFTSGIVVILVLLMRQLFKGKISLRLQYGLWLLVLVRLLVPVNLFDTNVSILNLLSVESETDTSHAGPGMNAGAVSQQDGGQKNNMTHASYTENSDHKELSVPEKEEPTYNSGKTVKGTVRLSELVLAVWAAGMIVAAAVLGGINIHFSRRLRRVRKPLEDRDRSLPVYIVQGISSPCLFGLIHPAIYLPEEITEEQLPYVLAHEESHYRAGDHIWSLLRSVCMVLHWYHPLVWLAAYVSRQDSELACDERTIRHLGEDRRNDYGRILVDLTIKKASTADFLCCATTMTADGRSLKERVQMIAHKPHMLAATSGIVAVLAVTVFCVACTGARDDTVSEPDAIGSGVLENGGNDTPETLEGSEDENALNTEGKSNENTDQGESDGLDPAEDHTLSDNAYYRVVQNALIDDPYFTMEIPVSLVGKVAYGVVLTENATGGKSLQYLTFFHIDSTEPVSMDEQQGVPQYTWHDVYGLGALCSYGWTGYLDLEEDLEDIVNKSGTWDIRGMEFTLAQDYDMYAGVGGRLVQANEAGTGAYFYMQPTDVQFDPEDPEEYMTCAGELAECWNNFTAKSFPYEELEEYSGESYSDIPQWRQDFEAAERAYSWFTDAGQVPGRALTDSDIDSRLYEAFDGLLYRVVDVPGIDNMDDLRNYLNRYFAPEIVEELMSGQRPGLGGKGDIPPFVEENGVLYAAEGVITENGYCLNACQYTAYFTELTETGQQRSIQTNTENGGRRRAKIYMDCQYSTVGDDISAVLCYTMEEQEDGSWRIIEDFELPAHLLMVSAGYYSSEADRVEAFLVR